MQDAPRTPLGTFATDNGGQIVITYNPALTNNPSQMVATFAHELAHYLTATSEEEPPGGWENWEFATDITATFLGFGIFMANSAFSFQQFSSVDSEGWQSNRNDYLSEAEQVYALAIFLSLKNLPLAAATPYLKTSLKKMLKRALSEIVDDPAVQALATLQSKSIECMH